MQMKIWKQKMVKEHCCIIAKDGQARYKKYFKAKLKLSCNKNLITSFGSLFMTFCIINLISLSFSGAGKFYNKRYSVITATETLKRVQNHLDEEIIHKTWTFILKFFESVFKWTNVEKYENSSLIPEHFLIWKAWNILSNSSNIQKNWEFCQR